MVAQDKQTTQEIRHVLAKGRAGTVVFVSFVVGVVLFFVVMVGAMGVSVLPNNASRGFVPCSEKLIDCLQTCQTKHGKTSFFAKLGCGTGCIFKMTKCNVGIICESTGNWVFGDSPTPWAGFYTKTEEAETVQQSNEPPDMISVDQQLEQMKGKVFFPAPVDSSKSPTILPTDRVAMEQGKQNLTQAPLAQDTTNIEQETAEEISPHDL